MNPQRNGKMDRLSDRQGEDGRWRTAKSPSIVVNRAKSSQIAFGGRPSRPSTLRSATEDGQQRDFAPCRRASGRSATSRRLFPPCRAIQPNRTKSRLIVVNPVICLATFEPSNARRSGECRPLVVFGDDQSVSDFGRFALRISHLCSSVVVPTIYKTYWEQAKTHGTFLSRRLAAFSPREKVPAGRMRGKGARPTKVYPIAETSPAIRFLSVSIGRPSFGCLLPIIGSVVEKFVEISAIRVKAFWPFSHLSRHSEATADQSNSR